MKVVKYGLLGVLIIATAVISTCLVRSNMKAEEMPRKEVLLSTYYSRDRNHVYLLYAKFKYEHGVVNYTQNKVRLMDFDLVVLQLSATPWDGRQLLDRQYKTTWKHQGFSGPPLWERGYIPRSDFILPTGEFFELGDNGPCLVVFDGSFHLFVLDASKTHFIETTMTPAITSELNKRYSQAFKANDVYWSYGLVTHPEFFGMPISSGSIKKQYNIEELFQIWNKIVLDKSPPPNETNTETPPDTLTQEGAK